VLCVVFFVYCTVFPAAFASDASSTTFYVRQNTQDIVGRATSTSFGFLFGAEQNGPGLSSSTSFKIISGILRSLFQPIAPSYEQTHYHWRNDDGGETTSTSATSGVQDTSLPSLASNTIKRLRIEISNEGGTIKSFSSQQFRLEYGFLVTSCSAISAWTNVQGGTDWSMATTTNLVDGTNTTNIATSTGGVGDSNNIFLTPNGGVKTTGSTAGPLSVPSNTFVELEYGVKALAAATSTGTYCFRVTNAGSPSNFVYTQYPQATVLNSSQSISLSFTPSTVNLPGFAPGVAVSVTSTVTVSISGGTSGYSLKINRNSTTSTLASSTLTFPDYTLWNPGTGCSVGQGNATTTPGSTFSFRVQLANITASYCSAWWGANDTNGTAFYAGTPTSAQTVMNCTTCNSGSTDTTIQYRADAPTSQNATDYSGTITLTAIANP
jgi:hypothetical protein